MLLTLAQLQPTETTIAGGAIVLCMVVLKIAERLLNKREAKVARESGDDPLHSIKALMVQESRNLEHITKSMGELRTIAARQQDLLERMDRRQERLELEMVRAPHRHGSNEAEKLT